MADEEKPKPAEEPKAPEPVNQRGVASLTLVAFQNTPVPGGGTQGDPVVVARLRCSIDTVVELRDRLNQIITAATPAEGKGH